MTNLLHCAAAYGSKIIVQRCLDLGVDVYARDDFGRTALHGAADFGRLSIVKMLVQAGSDINALDVNESTPLACAQDYNSRTPWAWTSVGDMRQWTRSPDVVKYLSDLGPEELLHYFLNYSCSQTALQQSLRWQIPERIIPFHKGDRPPRGRNGYRRGSSATRGGQDLVQKDVHLTMRRNSYATF